MVFGMLCEEWGLIVAVLAIASIVTLAVFAVRACRVGRSSFYVIAACAAGSLMVFQTCLNVFGSVDLLPLTGVTLPFVSNGGSAMLSAWGLLAFLKATDTRENASFAIQRGPGKRLTEEARRRTEPVREDEFRRGSVGEDEASGSAGDHKRSKPGRGPQNESAGTGFAQEDDFLKPYFDDGDSFTIPEFLRNRETDGEEDRHAEN